jgi:hypothetical protein
MDPALAFRHLVDRRRQGWLDEAGVGRLDPDRRRLFALERHGQIRRIGSGNWIAVPALVAIGEILQEDVLIVAAGHDRGCPVGPKHYQNSTPQNRDSKPPPTNRSGF